MVDQQHLLHRSQTGEPLEDLPQLTLAGELSHWQMRHWFESMSANLRSDVDRLLPLLCGKVTDVELQATGQQRPALRQPGQVVHRHLDG